MLPAIVCVLVLALWGVGVAVAHLRCVDAARAAARAVARGDDVSAARAAAAAIAPQRARVAVDASGRVVRVEVAAGVALPGPAFARLPVLTVRAAAVAQQEPR